MERIGHRGAKREFPENTVAAFVRAFELGADAVELDVHVTADGVVVVHHDPDVRRFGHRAMPIASTPFSELRTVDLGSGLSIPSLAEVLAVTPADATVYVEIKGLGIEQAVASIIDQTSVRCAAHSFDHATIRRMRSIAPDIPRGILFDADEPKPGSDASSRAAFLGRIASVSAEVDARDVWPHWSLIDRDLVDAVHSRRGRVIAWTVNDTADAERLAALGVDGLCGDDVRLLG